MADSTIARLFSEYRQKKNAMITRYETIEELIIQIKGNKIEKEDLSGMGIFSVGSTNLGDLYENLQTNGDRILSLCKELITEFKKETSEITKHLGELRHEAIDSVTRLNNLLISHNQTQQQILQKLQVLIPNLVKTGEEILGVEDVGLHKGADLFTNEYNMLTDLIMREAPKGDIFDSLRNIFDYLRDYSLNVTKLSRDPQNALLSLVHHQEARQFVYNYFSSSADRIHKNMEKLIKDMKKDSYDNCSNKKDIDKFMKGILKDLYNDGKGNNSGSMFEEIRDKIDEHIKAEGDFDDVKKAVGTLVDRIGDYIITEAKDYIMGSDNIEVNNIREFKIAIFGELVEIKNVLKFEKEKEKDLKEAKRILQKLENEKKDRENWMKKQVDYGVIRKKGGGSSSSSNDKLSDAEKTAIRNAKEQLYRRFILNAVNEIDVDELNDNKNLVEVFIQAVFGDVPGKKDFDYPRFEKTINTYKNSQDYSDTLRDELIEEYKSKSSISDFKNFLEKLLKLINISQIN